MNNLNLLIKNFNEVFGPEFTFQREGQKLTFLIDGYTQWIIRTKDELDSTISFYTKTLTGVLREYMKDVWGVYDILIIYKSEYFWNE